MRNYGKEPSIREIQLANKAVGIIESCDVSLSLPGLEDTKQIKVVASSDVSHANILSEAWWGGFIVFLGGRGKVLPFMW